MLDPELARTIHVTGPIASLYLPTPSNEPQAGRQATVRWRNLRRELSEAGADDATVMAMDTAVGVDTVTVAGGITGAPENHPAAPPADETADHGEGDVLAVIAADGEVLVRRALPAGVAADGVRWGAVAWLTPILAATQAQGAQDVAQLVERLQGGEVLVTAEEQVATTYLASAPAPVLPLLRKLEGGNRRDPEADAADGARLARTVEAEGTVARIQAFRAELGGGHHAASGPEPVIAALQMAMVETLLVNDDPADTRLAWMAPDGSQLALDPGSLADMGIDGAEQDRLIDICVRVALLQGADVRLVPASVLLDGLGAMLRATAVAPH